MTICYYTQLRCCSKTHVPFSCTLASARSALYSKLNWTASSEAHLDKWIWPKHSYACRSAIPLRNSKSCKSRRVSQFVCSQSRVPHAVFSVKANRRRLLRNCNKSLCYNRHSPWLSNCRSRTSQPGVGRYPHRRCYISSVAWSKIT